MCLLVGGSVPITMPPVVPCSDFLFAWSIFTDTRDSFLLLSLSAWHGVNVRKAPVKAQSARTTSLQPAGGRRSKLLFLV